MSYIDKIVVDSTEYDVQDTDAHDKIERLEDGIKINTGATAIQFSSGYIATNVDSVDFDNIDSAVVTSLVYRYAVLACAPGDAFTITCEGGSTARPYAFYRDRESGYQKIYASTELTLSNRTITAPEGSAYIIINDKSFSSSFVGVPIINKVTALEKGIDGIGTPSLGKNHVYVGAIGTGENAAWAQLSNESYKYTIIPVKSNDVLEIIAGSSSAYIAFLRSYAPPLQGTNVDFSSATGFTQRLSFSAGNYKRYVVPDDVNYILIQLLSNNTDTTPSMLTINGYDCSKSMQDNIAATNDSMTTKFEMTDIMPFGGYELHYGNIASTGKWTSFNGTYKTVVFPVKAGAAFTITGSNVTLYAVLKSKPIIELNAQIPYSENADWNTRKDASTTPSGTLPDDAKYMAIVVLYNGNDSSPTSLVIDGIDYVKTVYDNMRDVAEDVSELQNTASVVASSAYEYTLYDCTSIGTAYTGYSGGPSGSSANAITMSQNASYDSYVFSVDRDTSVYVDPTGISYYALNVGVGGTGDWYSTGSAGALKHDFTSAVRYRTSDNNLPTIDNPLSISAGSMLVISVTAGKQPTIYMQDSSKTVKAKFGQILCVVGDTEITLSGTNYKAIWRKRETTQGYQWNLDDVIGQTKSVLSDSTDIVGVLRFTGQSNFMGGKHGNENVVSFKMLANGADIENGKSYEQVTVLMLSHLYDPDNTSVNPVDRIVEMTFRPDGWTSRVTFLIRTSATVDTAYPCGLFGFNAADADYCMTNVGVLDLTSTASQPIANTNLKQLTVNLTDNATITIVGEEYDATPFVTYRSNTQSFKIYWPKARNLTVSSGDVITGVCHYYF